MMTKIKKDISKYSGFTLIEFIIVIAMIGILSAIAIPATIKHLPNYRLKATVRDLYSNMQKAKIEAAKINTPVIIQFTTGTYSPAGQVGSYQMSIDSNGNSVYDAGETILFQEPMPRNVSLISTTFAGNTAGFTPSCTSMEITSKNVQFQNNRSRYYKISLSPAGGLRMDISSDGLIWN